jgi:hypothetical protein
MGRDAAAASVDIAARCPYQIYLERGSEHHLVRGTTKSRGRVMAERLMIAEIVR